MRKKREDRRLEGGLHLQESKKIEEKKKELAELNEGFMRALALKVAEYSDETRYTIVTSTQLS